MTTTTYAAGCSAGCGASRGRVSARERGTTREQLDYDELARLGYAGGGAGGQASAGTGSLILDNRRRPLYFDGRFLTAGDLTREQNYFLSRQADLCRAGGTGVVSGLLVTRGPNARSIRIAAGHGVTPSGELVAIPYPVELDLMDIVKAQRLDVAFGLSRVASTPLRSRLGLFIVALRPVEFTANPIAAYPTSITGQRPAAAHDGDIVEATAITLIQYPDDGARNELAQRRARAARDIFVAGATRGLAGDALPLAMIALDLEQVAWVDSYMVRREVGAEHGDVLGLGFAPRAAREAYLLQYDNHLQEVLDLRQARGWHFAATEHFTALPPAGQMPTASIDARDFTQIFFPAEVDVELSFVPEDELMALIEESLLLPPIDLTLSDDDLESTSVLVAIPVPRHQVRLLSSTLASLSRPLPSATPGLLARRRPLQMLRDLTLPRTAIVANPEDAANAPWRAALNSTDLLWYMRRRNLNYKAAAAGIPVEVAGNDLIDERNLRIRLGRAGLLDRYDRLRAAASPAAVPVIVSALAASRSAESAILTEAVMRRFEANVDALDRRAAVVAADLVSRPDFGTGIAAAEKVNPQLADPNVVDALLKAGSLQTIERLGTAQIDGDRLNRVLGKVVDVAGGADAQAKLDKLTAIGALAERIVDPAVQGSTVLKAAALDQIERVATGGAASGTAMGAFSQPAFGAGVRQLEVVRPELRTSAVAQFLVSSDVVQVVDQLASATDDSAIRLAMADSLVRIAQSGEADRQAGLQKLKETAAAVAEVALGAATNKSAAVNEVFRERLRGLGR